MSQPLSQLKAEFFKALGHPVRIRVLELLAGLTTPGVVRPRRDVAPGGG